MSEILGNASPVQLLMYLTVPVLGIIFFATIGYISFSDRSKKQKMKLGSSSKTASLLNSSGPAALSSVAPDNPVTAGHNSDSPELFPDTDPLADLDLNLDILGPRSKTEAEMMNTSRSSQESRTGLSARLGQNTRSAPDPTPPEVNRPTAVNLSQTNPPLKQSIAAPRAGEPEELLRLLRDPQGQLIIEIAGRRYTRLAEIADKEIGQYILKLTAHLLAFTNGLIATDAGLKTFPPPKVGQAPPPPVAPLPAEPLRHSAPEPPVSAPPAPAALVQPGSSEVETAFLDSLRTRPAPEAPQPQRRGFFGRAKPAGPEPLLPALNLAGQINEIVQARLRYSPLAATTKLEITSDPSGGILIHVNGRVYQGADEVPHGEVKELIKASIKEWEKS